MCLWPSRVAVSSGDSDCRTTTKPSAACSSKRVYSISTLQLISTRGCLSSSTTASRCPSSHAAWSGVFIQGLGASIRTAVDVAVAAPVRGEIGGEMVLVAARTMPAEWLELCGRACRGDVKPCLGLVAASDDGCRVACCWPLGLVLGDREASLLGLLRPPPPRAAI